MTRTTLSLNLGLLATGVLLACQDPSLKLVAPESPGPQLAPSAASTASLALGFVAATQPVKIFRDDGAGSFDLASPSCGFSCSGSYTAAVSMQATYQRTYVDSVTTSCRSVHGTPTTKWPALFAYLVRPAAPGALNATVRASGVPDSLNFLHVKHFDSVTAQDVHVRMEAGATVTQTGNVYRYTGGRVGIHRFDGKGKTSIILDVSCDNLDAVELTLVR